MAEIIDLVLFYFFFYTGQNFWEDWADIPYVFAAVNVICAMYSDFGLSSTTMYVLRKYPCILHMHKWMVSLNWAGTIVYSVLFILI